MTTATSTIEQLANKEYQYGFVSDIDTEAVPKGLSEDVVRLISAKKNEPAWLLDWRLKAYRHWRTMDEPRWWPNLSFPRIDYQDSRYFAAPTAKVDQEQLEREFERLGISLQEKNRLSGVAVDAVIDSVSVKTTFQKELG